MLDVLDPWSLSVVDRVAVTPEADIDGWIARALARLRAVPPAHLRAAWLEEAARRLQDRAEAFAMCIREEAGKPIRLARAEVLRAVDTLRLSALEARAMAGEVVPLEGTASGAGRVGFTLREPVGVVVAVTPFNFPLNLVAHKVGPALAAGCPVLLKPAERTPRAGARLVELLHEVGVPEDMVACVQGIGRDVVPRLVTDPRVALVTFTGSAAVGRALQVLAPHRPVMLELGGAAAAIVDEGVDVDRVARALVAGAYGYAGQSCISVQRIFASKGVAAALEQALVAAASELVVGDPSREDVVVGPLIRPEEARRVDAWAREAVSSGARCLLGTSHSASEPASLLRPILLADAPASARVLREEVFGPLAVVCRVDGVDEGVARANEIPGALNVGLFTPSVTTAMTATRALQAGAVLWNESPTWRADAMPYGGTGEAGNTREGPRWTVRAMTREKLVVIS